MSANRLLLASCRRQTFRVWSQQTLALTRRPAAWVLAPHQPAQTFTSTASGSDGGSSNTPPSMEDAVSEQQQVLFPRLQELEEARQREDVARRATSVPTEQWSPRQVPYKVYEKKSGADDSDEDSETEDEEPSAETLQADGADIDGLQVGLEEPEETGFRYAGPEPTLYGDWAHKGRVTDF
mmetsp:Transcript_4841/g.14081  ORF Transcript_4841/g.14081 Transcript_4841/m.14081 type:complete len:181 (-) Transcript_4841:97-639(-)